MHQVARAISVALLAYKRQHGGELILVWVAIVPPAQPMASFTMAANAGLRREAATTHAGLDWIRAPCCHLCPLSAPSQTTKNMRLGHLWTKGQRQHVKLHQSTHGEVCHHHTVPAVTCETGLGPMLSAFCFRMVAEGLIYLARAAEQHNRSILLQAGFRCIGGLLPNSLLCTTA